MAERAQSRLHLADRIAAEWRGTLRCFRRCLDRSRLRLRGGRLAQSKLDQQRLVHVTARRKADDPAVVLHGTSRLRPRQSIHGPLIESQPVQHLLHRTDIAIARGPRDRTGRIVVRWRWHWHRAVNARRNLRSHLRSYVLNRVGSRRWHRNRRHGHHRRTGGNKGTRMPLWLIPESIHRDEAERNKKRGRAAKGNRVTRHYRAETRTAGM